MPSERIRRRIELLLDETEAAVSANEWPLVADKSRAVLAIDEENEDALAFLAMADANVGSAPAPAATARQAAAALTPPTPELPLTPESFAGGRYEVRRFLGKGDKKRVFVAHDALLDRDVAFSLIKTEGLDDVGREHIMREARAMGRLTHPHIVSIFDIGEQTSADGTGQPYFVQELMGGGDLEALLEQAEGGLPLDRALRIGIEASRGLEFAHAQGVVHGGLKPGTVWLTADGTAKIGDLGFATQLSETRLTAHGTMVGAVQCMAPEQALGQEVTAQTDVYSLGVMLYEMVTGRVPFQGDTPTSVISQHLNTPPVAPSWYSDHCPPDLEALILHCLEKDPTQRPATATEVREALERVDPAGKSRSHSDSQSNQLDRLARGVFVGREPELQQLRAALDGALEGRGSVVMLVGEPGIGKTRTMQELETYARMRGAEVYWGRTYESGGMPAYWPWLQVGRAWGARQEFAEASVQAAVANPQLLRLFPNLREVVQAPPPDQTPVEREATQFLLFDAYTQWIRARCESVPWMIVLDDLHWADKPTLQLLQFVARELSNARVLVVGTYRDTDLVRAHPLSEALAELNRTGEFQRIVLKGLSHDEVASYIQQRASAEVPTELLDRIYEETEGNPFFLAEVVNLLVEEGALDREQSSRSTDIRLPDGVREALGRRLDRLSADANVMLQVAAVVGREFAYETLLLLTDGDEEDLVAQLDEALELRVIEDSDRIGRYRFTHALMQETLIEELNTVRRTRLHGLIGEVLEQRWGDSIGRRAPILAHHFAESAALSREHARKAVRYLIASANEAAEVAAWSDVAVSVAQAVELADGADVPIDRGELLLTHGKASRSILDYRSAMRSLLTALSALDEAGKPERAAQAVLEVGEFHVPAVRLAPLIDHAVLSLGDRDAHLTARLLAKRASFMFRDEAAETAATRANELAERYDFGDVRGILLAERALHEAWIDGRFGDVASIGTQASRLLEVAGMNASAGLALYLSALAQLVRGDIEAFTEATASLDDLVKRTGDGRTRNEVLAARAFVPWQQGDYASAIKLMEQMDSIQLERYLCLPIMWAETGDLERAMSLLPDPWPERSYDPYLRAMVHLSRARLLDLAGHDGVATSEVQDWAQLAAVHHRGDVWSLSPVLIFTSGATIAKLADLEVVSDFYRHLSGLPELVLGQQILGLLALRLDRMTEARNHFDGAIAWAAPYGRDLEVAVAHVGLAEIGERQGEVEAAREHLDTAGELFGRHGAKLYLDQVIAMKRMLNASPVQRPDGLSPREIEVLAQLAAGRSNREIAETLVLSVHTVERHVANIYAKTGLRNRSQATRYALAHGLRTEPGGSG